MPTAALLPVGEKPPTPRVPPTLSAIVVRESVISAPLPEESMPPTPLVPVAEFLKIVESVRSSQPSWFASSDPPVLWMPPPPAPLATLLSTSRLSAWITPRLLAMPPPRTARLSVMRTSMIARLPAL